jgi:hypothetical protein
MSSREIRRGREGKERRRTIGLGGAAGAGEEAMVARTSGSMQRRRWTSRRLQPLLSIGLGKEVVAVTVAVNLMFCAPGPHLLFIGLRDRGPPTRSRLSIPDQDAVKGSELAVGPIRLRSILTFSPLISTYLLTLNFDFNSFYFYLFHYRLVYRACFIVTVNCR